MDSGSPSCPVSQLWYGWGQYTVAGMKGNKQGGEMLWRSWPVDCGRCGKAVVCFHWLFLLGILISGSDDCSRTELLSSGVTHFKFILCQDPDFILLSPAVWVSTRIQKTLNTFSRFSKTLSPSGALDCHFLLVIRPQAVFSLLWIRIKIRNKEEREIYTYVWNYSPSFPVL